MTTTMPEGRSRSIKPRSVIGFACALAAMVALSAPAAVRAQNKVALLEWASTPRTETQIRTFELSNSEGDASLMPKQRN